MSPPELLERRSIISGIGQSDVGRRLGRGELDLTVDACLQAVADAGLTRDDIDGLATFPGAGVGTGGFAGPPTPEVQDALRLKLNWHDGGLEGPGQLRAVFAACLAVAAGLARHVLVYRTVTESSPRARADARASVAGGGGRGIPRFSGSMQWTLPYGAVSAANWLAMIAQRRMYEFGLTREQLAWIALNGRRNAARNPKAIYRDPMSLDDYLGVRMISSPLCLYDCDAPCDGSTAVVVSHVDYAPDTPRTACHVNAIGTALRGRPSWDQFDDMTTFSARDAAASMWERTELRPSDVDVAELYDGFSILTMVWLEELGLCGKGESGPFVDGGRRIASTGPCPSTRAGASSRPAACTASGCCTRRVCSCGARAANARSRPRPKSPRWPPGVVPSPGACSSPEARPSLQPTGAWGPSPLADTNVRQLRSPRAPALRRADRGVSPGVAGLDGGQPPSLLGAHRAGPVLGAHSRVGAGLAAQALRQRLAGAGLAPRVRRPQRHPGPADGVLRGARPPRRPPQLQPPGPVHHHALHPRLRHRGAEGALRAAHAAGRDQLVPGDERAQRRK